MNPGAERRTFLSRRDLLGAAGAGAVAAGIGAGIVVPGRAQAARILKLLQWTHFVPRYDREWFGAFARTWGEANGVEVTVDHIQQSQIEARASAEVAGVARGHDLIEWVFPPAQFEPRMLDLTDINREAERRFGAQLPFCKRSSFNPRTNKYYGFCHGWAIDPGNYRKSLWARAGQPQGPETWDDLITVGGEIKRTQGVPLGIGLSQEIDSNMAARALLWSWDTGVQDQDENVILNNDRTLAAVRFMARLYHASMIPEVFAWEATSNNRALVAGRASYILNSTSAYRSAQKSQPEVARDIFFVPPLAGPRGTRWASQHVIYTYTIPRHSRSADTAKEFLLALVENYDQAMYFSELYNSPAFFDTPVPPGRRGYRAVAGARTLRGLQAAWFDSDPFALSGEATGKLKVLTRAPEWSTSVGHPGPANPAIGEVFSTFLLPNMMANAARGLEPSVSIAQAELLTRAIFDRWRGKGLVGGTR